jgi:hypothetical protein
VSSACAEIELAATEVLETTGTAAILTGSQIRAACALLGLRVVDLAKEAGLSYAAVQRAESVNDVPRNAISQPSSRSWKGPESSFSTAIIQGVVGQACG